MNEMENMKIELTALKKDMEYVRKDVAEIKDTMKKLLEIVNNSIPALRNDVNLANQQGQENKLRINEHDIRINNLENDKTSRDALINAFKWIVGIIGISNLGTILYLVLRGLSQGN